jgi:hypothetical protein
METLAEIRMNPLMILMIEMEIHLEITLEMREKIIRIIIVIRRTGIPPQVCLVITVVVIELVQLEHHHLHLHQQMILTMILIAAMTQMIAKKAQLEQEETDVADNDHEGEERLEKMQTQVHQHLLV